MPTRLNYTKRKKLSPEQVTIQVYPADTGPASFDALFQLEALRPQADEAHIFVEAYHHSSRMRFDFGTVATPVSPPPEQRLLAEFPDWEQVLFRVKITDTTSTVGKLLAWRNQIRPNGPDGRPRNDLLHFINEPLDGLVWDLYFDEDLGPVVRVNPTAGDRHEVGMDDRFIAAAYPEIMRRTLHKAFIEDKWDTPDEEHWSWHWMEGFLKPQLGMPPPPPFDDQNLEARLDWIDEAVRTFARHNRLDKLWGSTTREEA